MDYKVVIIIVVIIAVAVFIKIIYKHYSDKKGVYTSESICRPQTNFVPTSRNTTTYRTTAVTQNTTNIISTNSNKPLVEVPGVVDYYANDRHNSPDNWYRFKFKKVDDNWRVFIVRMPSLRGRDSNLHSTHRYTDHNGNYWICWDGDVPTLKFAQDMARTWGDRLLEYINTGTEFKDQN